MSALILEAGPGSLDGSLDPLLGIVAVRLKCTAPDLVTAITGAVPSIGLHLVENQPRTFSRDPAGDQAGYHVEVTLEGVHDPENAEGEEFSLEGSTGQEPIDTSPRIGELQVIYQYDEAASKKEARSIWPDKIGGHRNRMHGVDVFYDPSLIWTHRWVSRRLPASVVKGLGFIDKPPGNPPELDGNRNWLKIRASASWRGNVWKIEESWLMSSLEGWIPELYGRR